MPHNAPAWEQRLRAMVQYYTSCQLEENPRKFLGRYPVKQPNENVDPEVRDKLKQVGGESIAEHKDVADEMHNLTEELKADSTPDRLEWILRMNQKREELKLKSTRIIDEKTDEAIDYIYTLPDQERETAAEFWRTIVVGFIQSWADAWDQIEIVVGAVAGWNPNMWETINSALQHIGKAFESSWNWLKNLF